MNEKKEVLYLMIIQQQEQQIKKMQGVISQLEIGLIISLLSFLAYLLINLALTYSWSKLRQIFQFKKRTR